MLIRILLSVFILIWGGLLAVSHCVYGNTTGLRYFRNYHFKEDYNHHPQNWCITQNSKGIIYVGNQGGLLIYDGSNWEVFYEDIPNSSVYSLAIDEKSGTLYIGGNNEFGYLSSEPNDSLTYVSLKNHLKEEFKNFSKAWKIHPAKHGIYFRTPEYLFRWRPGSQEMKAFPAENRFMASFLNHGDIFVQEKDMGLKKIEGNSLKLLPGSSIFAKKRIFMIAAYGPDEIIIGAEEIGFYVYDGKNWVPFPTKVNTYLQEKQAYHGIRLSSGDFALATRNGGLVILDKLGRLKDTFDNKYGIQNNKVWYVFEDREGNLWLALNKGISMVEYRSPISIFDERSKLDGLVQSTIKHDQKIYAGTTDGLFYLQYPLMFTRVPDIRACWDLLSVNNSLLAATSGGVFQIYTSRSRQLSSDPSYCLYKSRKWPGKIWCGTRNGLRLLKYQKGRWEEEHLFETVNQPILSIVEDRNGNVWLGTSIGIAIKMKFPPDNMSPVVIRYDKNHGLPDGNIYTAWAGDHIILATQKGIYRPGNNELKVIGDTILGPQFTGGQEGSKPVFRVIESSNSHIWFISKSRIHQAIPKSTGDYEIRVNSFLRLPDIQIDEIYPDPNGKCIWFGSHQGLIHYDLTLEKNYQQDFFSLIRRVQANENVIFDNKYYKTGNISKEPRPTLPYKDRNINFDIAAPFFEANSEVQYQHFLVGFETDWNNWDKNKMINYTNLDSGVYTLRVRAKNVYGTISQEAVYQFEILPPWYRTWWAFMLYGIVILLFIFLLIFLLIKWRSRRLEREKQKLEQTIKERTKEIQEKNQQLEKQTIQLKDQSEKLKEMDQLKSRFFANISHEFRTPLTLIMSPLEQMIADSRDKEQKKKLKVMLRSSQGLLTLINQLLDLSRFDSGKMELHAACQNIVPFLKGTLASFHMVAVEKQLELVFHSEEGEIILYFDAPKMEEVMYNLLVNAIKFTPTNGKITVSVTRDKHQQVHPNEGVGFVVISVQDTGVGISQEQLSHIFDRFYQAEGLKESGHKGTGIGLALTKEIVMLHHGKIDVHSQEGKGAQFIIRLPMGREHLKPSEIVSSSEVASGRGKYKEIEILHLKKGLEEEEEEIHRDASETENGGDIETEAQEKNVILVVEDSTDVREYIRAHLDPIYTVVEAKDGEEGIARAKEIIPDLIVSDIMMPSPDGYELCRVLKKDILTSHIPIILLTAKASEESIIQGLETGADDYITKPFHIRMLLSRIKNLIDLRRQLQLKIQRQKMLLPSETHISSTDEKFLKEFQNIIEENLSNPEFTIDILCKKLYIGRTTLFRKIQALTGETPNQFIQSYRLERGAQLLRENYGNTTDVAIAVGFSSAAYFARCFKDKFHQLPSSFQASESKSKGKF